MELPLLVGISGVKRSGKGTAAHCIQRWAASLGLKALDRGFADKVKWAFARQFFAGIDMATAIEWVDNYKDSNHEIVMESPIYPSQHIFAVPFRDAVAQFATEGARDIYSMDHWVDQLLPTSMIIDENDLVVAPQWHESFMTGDTMADVCTVSDMRFPNEFYRMSHVLNAFTIKIRRAEAERNVIEEARAKGVEIHRSELGLPDDHFDVVINNDSTIEELDLRIRHTMNEYYKP